MADDRNEHNEKNLPWPEDTDPVRLGDSIAHGAAPEQREVGENFAASNEDSARTLGREFSDVNAIERERLGRSFADPNAMDDQRLAHNFEETNSSRKKRRRPLTEVVHAPANRRPLYIGLAVFAALFVLVLLVGGLPKLFRHRDIDKQAEVDKESRPVVEVTKVTRGSHQAGLALPATTIALNEAYVYARANGYLKSYRVDIGDHVKKNQLLAVIESPDLDAQVDQAREQLHQAEQQVEQQKSQLALENVTVQRYRVLVTKGVLSRQQGDQQEANFLSAQANLAAAQRNVQAYRANLDRVRALQSYEQVRAPFDGVVTQRNVDTGALISAGGSTSGPIAGPAPQGQTSSAGGTAQAAQSNNAGSSGSVNSSATTTQSPGQGGPLFGIAQVGRLRVLISVPEAYAASVKTGQRAQLAFQEYPGQTFEADVTRTAESIDQNTRTMLTEVQIDNQRGKLLPGMYVVATLPPTPGEKGPLLISGDAIAIRHDQSMVATVADGKVRFVPITIGRDYGDEVEVLTGLKEGDLVVTNITDDVVDNAAVQARETRSQERKPQQAPAQNAPPGGGSRYSNQAITDQNLQGEQQQQNQKSQGKGSGESQKSGKSESKP